jgi:hypothetical protein
LTGSSFVRAFELLDTSSLGLTDLGDPETSGHAGQGFEEMPALLERRPVGNHQEVDLPLVKRFWFVELRVDPNAVARRPGSRKRSFGPDRKPKAILELVTDGPQS